MSNYGRAEIRTSRRLMVRRGALGARFLVGIFAVTLLSAQSVQQRPLEAEKRIVAIDGQLPLSFERNQGQTDGQVQFISRGHGYTLFLTPAGAVLSLQQSGLHSGREEISRNGGIVENVVSAATVLRMKLLGAASDPPVQGLDLLPGKVNYLKGSDPAGWKTGIPHFSRIRYEEVYPGVDLIYYGTQGQLEYDFVVAPGADPNVIHLSFKSTEKLRLDERGNLVLKTDAGMVTQQVPFIYQELDGVRQAISGGYVLEDEQVSFKVAQYNRSHPLIIDPVLTYSTYLGGAGNDAPLSIAVDGNGNAFVTGYTTSSDFPAENAIQPAYGGNPFDAFVTKLSADGSTLIFSTYLGGSGNDQGVDISLDAQGNAYLVGVTNSTDFPTSNAFQNSFAGGVLDGFVAKLSADGSALFYSTYLGGSNTDRALGLAVDAAGSAYVAGDTTSPDYPTANPLQPALNGVQDAFVTKLDPTGSFLSYSTYLGGSLNEQGQRIAVDAQGNAHVMGKTFSADYPTLNPFQPIFSGGDRDLFVSKLNATGQALVYSTFLGGSDIEDTAGLVEAIAVDGFGNAFVTGDTRSLDFPTLNPYQPTAGGNSDAFLTKFDGNGSALFSTYLGRASNEFSQGIAVDSQGNVYLAGSTGSPDFPTVDPIQAVKSGSGDAFVTKFRGDGSTILFSTFLGGFGNDQGTDIALDGAGNVFVTGFTASSNFPTLNAFQAAFAGGGNDGFVTRIRVEGPLTFCSGFEPPLDNGPVTVKKNRVLPLKAKLLDFQGVPLTDSDLASHPVIQVLYDSGTGPAVDVTDEALPAGQGTEGNEFVFTGNSWQFNLKTKNYTAAGTYTITMQSGDGFEYTVDTCQAQFVIEP